MFLLRLQSRRLGKDVFSYAFSSAHDQMSASA
jgi:hypothetical protein